MAIGGSAKRKRILLIEDDLDLRYSICSVLEDDGYETVSCIDAETGLRLLRAEKFDLVIVDHVLPGMSGATMIGSARSKGLVGEVPIVMITGMAVPPLDAEIVVFRKPFDLDPFLAKIKLLISARAT